MNNSQLLNEANEIKDKLISYRRELHQNPELSLEEFETTKKIKEWLSLEGIEHSEIDIPLGVIAEIKGAHPGPTIALRADIDALPVTEETGLSYSSKNEGVMHACGHDFHTTSMIGTAMLLNKRKNELHGNVRFIFQPAEEITVGAQKMIDAGALDGVEKIFGMHNKPEIPVGTIGVKSGALMASVDRFNIKVKGKGGHAGIPNKNIDPVVAGTAIVQALQSIVSRNVNPMDSAVISVCRIEGGKNWNVIPSYLELEGTVRTFSNDVQENIIGLMENLTVTTAKAYGASATIEWDQGLPPLINSSELEERVLSTAKELGISTEEAVPTPGGEDFSKYANLISGFFIWMGTNGTEDWHHPKFTIDEEVFPTSVSFFTQLSLNILKKSE